MLRRFRNVAPSSSGDIGRQLLRKLPTIGANLSAVQKLHLDFIPITVVDAGIAIHFSFSLFASRAECASVLLSSHPERDLAIRLATDVCVRLRFLFVRLYRAAFRRLCRLGFVRLPGDCCGSSFWPDAMSGNPNITVNVSGRVLPHFQSIPSISNLIARNSAPSACACAPVSSTSGGRTFAHAGSSA